MGQNILNNNTRSIITRLYNANYYDFMLYNGDTFFQSSKEVENKVLIDFSTLNIVDGKLYSTVVWSGATNGGVLLKDIGFTGTDNGLIRYRKDRITNTEFLKILLESTYEIESGDTRLFLTPVTGNTLDYEYPMETVETEKEKYIAFKGGFYQGFFKLDGFDYQVFPDKITDDLTLHFDIRPRSDYETGVYTINHIHPENEGIFFYIGSRAENKFWPFYKTNEDIILSLKKVDAQSEGYFDGCGESGETYNVNQNNVIREEWLKDEPFVPEPPLPSYFVDDYFDEEHTEKGCVPGIDAIVKSLDNSYFLDDYYLEESGKTFILAKKGLKFDISHITEKGNSVSKCTSNIVGKLFLKKEDNTVTSLSEYGFNSDGVCHHTPEEDEEKKEEMCCICGQKYFKDKYYDDKCVETSKMMEEEYVTNDILIDTTAKSFTDSEGHEYVKKGYYEISTDNKFITFNQTPDGFTTDTWPEDAERVIYPYRKDWPNANYFVLMNQTPTGYTVDNIEQYNEAHQKDYNIHKDIRNNAFCLRVTENGAIGYRYAVLTCEEGYDGKYKIIEEYSKDGIVKKDQWNSINVRFVLIDAPKDKEKNFGNMRIMIYVNGFLVFISKELDAFYFKSLDEIYQKQEGVPYNMSLGGGSQGLLEAIVPDYYAISEYILPIERDFCGSFMGDIKSFKIYSGLLDYSSISDYLS